MWMELKASRLGLGYHVLTCSPIQAEVVAVRAT